MEGIRLDRWMRLDWMDNNAELKYKLNMCIKLKNK